MKGKVPSSIRIGEKAAYAFAAANGVDNQTVNMALGDIRESLMECCAKFDATSLSDAMKETPVRSKLRRKLELKRTKVSIAASKMRSIFFPVQSIAQHIVIAAI